MFISTQLSFFLNLLCRKSVRLSGKRASLLIVVLLSFDYMTDYFCEFLWEIWLGLKHLLPWLVGRLALRRASRIGWWWWSLLSIFVFWKINSICILSIKSAVVHQLKTNSMLFICIGFLFLIIGWFTRNFSLFLISECLSRISWPGNNWGFDFFHWSSRPGCIPSFDTL